MPISGTITMCQMDEETYNRGAAKSEPASCELGLTEGGEYCRGTPCRSCTALVEEPVGVDALFRAFVQGAQFWEWQQTEVTP